MQRVKLMAFLPLVLMLGACNQDPHARAVRYVENGNKFFEREKYKEASILYRRALASNADPRYGEAHYRLALTQLKLGSPAEAYRSLQNTIEFQPENADALTKLADLEAAAASQSGNQGEQLLEDAKKHATKLVGLPGGAYDGERILGQIALMERNSAEAVEHLQNANALKPDEPAVMMLYVTALIQNNQLAEGVALGKSFLERDKTYAPMYDLLYIQFIARRDYAKSEEIYRLKNENNPNNEQYVVQLASHYGLTAQKDKMEQTLGLLNDEKTFPQGHLAAGDFYYLRLRDFERAQQQYEAGVGASSDKEKKAVYQKRLVDLYAASNRGPEADRLLTEVLKEFPKDPEGLAMKAAMRLATGNREEIELAANELQGLVAQAPENHVLHFHLGRALLAKGDLEPARVQFNETVRLRPDFIAAREFLTRIYLSREDGQNALLEAEAILKMDPNNLTAHLARSSALLAIRDFSKAREELDFITKTYPNNVEARYQIGYLAFQERDYAKASQVFDALKKANPNDSRALLGTVEAKASQNRLPEAIKDMETATAAAPDRVDLRVALADLYVRGQRFDDAIKLYDSVIAKDPNNANVLAKLGEAYRRRGDINQSMDTFRKASQAAPNSAEPLIKMAMMLDGIGKHDQSKQVWEQVLRIQQDNPLALNNLAYIKAEEGTDLDGALNMARRAYQALPDLPDVADTLGWVYIKKNLNKEAVDLFTNLVQKYPKNPMYRLHYGMALIQKGDRATAKRELETALQNNPSKDEVTRIQELLKTL